jgi:ZIP family zinc transporter
MAEAALWGLLAASSLVFGAVTALTIRLSHRVIGLVMAFGAGALISAVAYEMLGEAVAEGDSERVVIGLLTGSLVFYGADTVISRMGASQRKRIQEHDPAEGQPQAIVLGTVLDGIPESLVIGMSLVDGGGASVALIAATFISNVPESIAATAGLKSRGWSSVGILAMWIGIAAVSAAAAALGYAIFEDATQTGTWIEAFAAGAILTMLADAMIPEAYEASGRTAGVVLVMGFVASLSLTLAA